MNLSIREQIKRITGAAKIIHTILAAGIMMTAMSCLAFSLTTNRAFLTAMLVVTFFLLSVSRVILFLSFKDDKMSNIKFKAYAATYLVCAGLAVGFYWVDVLIAPIAALYFASVISNRILLIVQDRRKRSFAFNIVILVIVSLMTLLSVGSGAAPSYYQLAIIITSSVITAQAFVDVVLYAFSSIKLNVLLKIIRKTYAGEILLGLLILIISFSFVFYITEPTFNDSYLNALWYSFAIVTTIGFGDFYAVGDVGRVLSVILGIYGIIVVAVITSIIVNFYNETTKEDEKTRNRIKTIENPDYGPDDDDDDDEQEEKEEEQKEPEK